MQKERAPYRGSFFMCIFILSFTTSERDNHPVECSYLLIGQGGSVEHIADVLHHDRFDTVRFEKPAFIKFAFQMIE